MQRQRKKTVTQEGGVPGLRLLRLPEGAALLAPVICVSAERLEDLRKSLVHTRRPRSGSNAR